MLTETDKQVLDHVCRYRLTTPQVLRRLFFPNKTLEDVRTMYRRLRRAGYLSAGSLWRHQPYYCAAAGALGEFPHANAGPLPEQETIDSFALLGFCCNAEGINRNAITREELRGFMPEMAIPAFQNDRYYLDVKNEEHRLGMIKVDRGFNYQRSADHLAQIVRKRKRFTAWEQLVEQGRFAVTFLTAWEKKAELIRAVLTERAALPIWSVAVVPELRHLVARNRKELKT